MTKESNDLDVEIGTPEEAKWTVVKNQAEKAIENAKLEVEINEKILELSKEKIKAEKAKV